MSTTLPEIDRDAERHAADTEITHVAGLTPIAIECLCPFCGSFNTDVGRPCRHCRTEDTTAARAAARKRVGPWFVLQAKNPAAPGMSLHALLTLIRQGMVTDRSVIRGPATGQLWRLAGKVRGISREFGSCYGCGGDLYAADPACPHCQRPQSLPADIDAAAAVEAARPVPAPSPGDRPLPRQDLLTPSGMAKAFSLGYTAPAGGSTAGASVSMDDLLPRVPADRPRPTALAAVTAVVGVAVIGWVLIHSLGRHPEPAAADDERPVIVATAAPSRSAGTPLALIPPVRPAVATPPVSIVPPAFDRRPVPADEPTALTAGANESSDTGSAGDDPKRLMAAGLSDEARGDYAAAVKQYERIESLSNDEWPADLKDRLTLARSAARTGDKD